MMRYLLSIWCLFILVSFSCAGQDKAASKEVLLKDSTTYILMNPKVFLGNGEVIQNAAIGIDSLGKINLLVDATTSRIMMDRFDVMVSLTGKYCYAYESLADDDYDLPHVLVNVSELGYLTINVGEEVPIKENELANLAIYDRPLAKMNDPQIPALIVVRGIPYQPVRKEEPVE